MSKIILRDLHNYLDIYIVGQCRITKDKPIYDDQLIT